MSNFVRLLPCMLLLLSCAGKHNVKPPVLRSSNLKSSFISLQPGKPYHLKTPKGAQLRIPTGAFSSAGGPVQLEIKEAYSATDILLAGLTTKSNGRLLQSGGMIYLDATVAGKKVELSAPIGISLPGPLYDPNMQLFKGELQDDSSINWVDPQPLTDSTPTAKNIAWGKALFRANCASCHKVMKDFTGPALAGLMARIPGRSWLYKYVQSPATMTQYDPYARALWKKWRPLIMTGFPQLNKPAIDAIVDYTENEARLNYSTEEPMPVNTIPAAVDSSLKDGIQNCGYDSTYFQRYDTGFTELPPVAAGTVPFNREDDNVTIYSFDINALGWYNLDCFIDNNTASVKPVNLLVTVDNPEVVMLSSYLLVPDGRLLADGTFDKGQYYFSEPGGNILLVPGKKAIVFVVGKKDGQLVYGTASFAIRERQLINIKLKVAKQEEIDEWIRSNKLEGEPIDIPENEYRLEKIECDPIGISADADWGALFTRGDSDELKEFPLREDTSRRTRN